MSLTEATDNAHTLTSTSTLLDLLEHEAEAQPNRVLYVIDAPTASPTSAPSAASTRRAISATSDASAQAAVAVLGASRLSTSSLLMHAQGIAATLQACASPGSRVVLALPNGTAYLEAFFGAVAAGMIAVPMYPPHPRRPQPQVDAILKNAEPSVVLTLASTYEPCRTTVERVLAGRTVHTLALDDAKMSGIAQPSAWAHPSLSPESTVLLQYTSGSTAEPKGVEITHGQMLANQRAISELVGFGGTGVSWLPLFHDMGLGFAIAALYCKGRCVLQSPATFATDPISWLQAISAYGARASAAPNFAFDLCTSRVSDAEVERLDLSSWTAAIVGAEPVRPATLRAFADKFARAQFRDTSFRPAYGMAEATLLITGTCTARPLRTVQVDRDALRQGRIDEIASPSEGIEIVSCGTPLSNHRVVIVDPERGTAADPGQVGEIWASGPSIARGYWQRPDDTASTFGHHLTPLTPLAQTPPKPGAPPTRGASPTTSHETYLRTGDLGVIIDGDLYVTGRLKDLLIIRGRNHYPQDIETAAERASATIVPHASAAFMLEEGEIDSMRRDQSHAVEHRTRSVLVTEVPRHTATETLASVAVEVREHVRNACDLEVDLLVFIPRGEASRTTSGKVQRRLTRARLIDGKLKTLAYVSTDHKPLPALSETPRLLNISDTHRNVAEEKPHTTTTASALASVSASASAENDADARFLFELWAKVLGVEHVGLRSHFFELGGHSMRALETIQRINDHFGVRLDYKDLYANPTLEGTLQAIARARQETVDASTLPSRNRSSHAAPLTTAQRRIFEAFERNPLDTSSNIAASTPLPGRLDVAALRAAFAQLIARHSALRTRIERAQPSGIATQRIEETSTFELREFDLSASPQDTRAAQRQSHIDAALAEPFDLGRHPLFRAILFREGHENSHLALVINHIVSDGWSLSILEQELRVLYAEATLGTRDLAALLPSPTATYFDYVDGLAAAVHDSALKDEAAAFWQRQLEGFEFKPAELPFDHPNAFDPHDTKTSAFRTVLSEEATSRIRAQAKASNAAPFVVLFSALARWLSATLATDTLVLGIPSANRYEPRFLGVVGYFVDPVVVPMRILPRESFSDLVGRTQRKIFEVLKWSAFPIEFVASTRGAACPGLRMFTVWYNMTTFGDMAKRTLTDSETRHRARGPDSHFAFSIYPSEYANAIELNAYYRTALYRPETIERAVMAFTQSLDVALEDVAIEATVEASS